MSKFVIVLLGLVISNMTLAASEADIKKALKKALSGATIVCEDIINSTGTDYSDSNTTWHQNHERTSTFEFSVSDDMDLDSEAVIRMNDNQQEFRYILASDLRSIVRLEYDYYKQTSREVFTGTILEPNFENRSVKEYIYTMECSVESSPIFEVEIED
jgi:hypothetical protein